MAWTTSDTRYESTGFTAIQEISPSDDLMHDDSILDEHVHLSNDEDFGNDHLPKDNASALVSTYETLAENSLLAKTGDMTTFINWYCRKVNKTVLTQADFERQAYEVVKAFYPDVIQLQFQMEECHKMLTDQVDWINLEGDQVRVNVNRPLPLDGPPGHVTIQTQFFFNKDLEYLRYGSKGSSPALSISKMKAASYPDFGLELLVLDGDQAMTGNIAYLSDFKEFDRGYVAFGGGAYGGRITWHVFECKSDEGFLGTSEENSQDCIVMPIWKDTSYFDSPTKDVDNGETKTADNARKIHKDHPIDNVIGKVQSTVQTRRMSKPTYEQGFLNLNPTSIAKLYLIHLRVGSNAGRTSAIQTSTSLDTAMGSEVQESKEKKEEGREETTKGSRKKMLRRKRVGKEQQQESLKKPKVEKKKESDKMIIDYMLHKAGIDKEDLEALWRIVKEKNGDTRPNNEFEKVLWGDLKVMFERDKRSDVWRILQGYRVTIWKLIDSSGVHFCRLHGFLEVAAAQSPHLGKTLYYRQLCALIDVHGEEMILRDGDKRLILNKRHDTSSYYNKPKKESINRIDIYNVSHEDYLEDLFANEKITNNQSGNPTFSSYTDLTSPEVIIHGVAKSYSDFGTRRPSLLLPPQLLPSTNMI
ncbi:hypothetical protein Tco_0209878 [Tanacetum coccineum]